MDGLKCFKKMGLIVLCLGVAASFVCADGDDDSQELKISLSQTPRIGTRNHQKACRRQGN